MLSELRNVLFYLLYFRRNNSLNTFPTFKAAILKIITYHINRMWKLKATANGNIAYVSLLKQLENRSTLF